MNLDDDLDNRVKDIIEGFAVRDKRYYDDVYDLLMWSLYGQEVFSQFGYGVVGWNFRQSNGEQQLIVKATESGVPLVAFVTSHSTTGCISKTLDLLYKGLLKWQKDKYPWT